MTAPAFEKALPDVLTRVDELPSLPAVALEVLRISQDEDATLDDLATCISRDPALAAKVLKLANSSLFGGGKAVTTLQRATMLLGMKTVKLMALSFSLAGSLPKNGRQGSFDYSRYWHRSLVCAIAARSLGRLVKSPHADEAFLCGLFAHFGKLVLARCLPEAYEPVVAEAGGWPTLTLEQERLGFNSTDVCATLLKTWDLPPLIYLTVGYASRLEALAPDCAPALRSLTELHGLAQLAETVLCDSEKGSSLNRLRSDMERLFGLAATEVDAFLVGLESGINEAADLLAIQLPAGIAHEEIVNQARLQIVNVSLGTAVDLLTARRRNQELEGRNRALETRATTDRLTGLPNRAAFDEFLEWQVRSRLDSAQPQALGLLMIDIDRFKRFNDTYGHVVGDEVLRMVGGVLERLTRKGDMAARYGGEEFAVVLPHTSPFGLRSAGERLRESIEKEVLVVDGQELCVTASIGGACATTFDDAKDGGALVKAADSLLYQAKKNGRNRCEVLARSELPEKG